MRQHIIDHVAREARDAARPVLTAGGTRRDVAVAAMRAASSSHAEPLHGEAFEAAIAALYELYPDDVTLREEAEAIGSRNARAYAMTAGDAEAAEAVMLTPMPAEPIGLLDAWNEATSVRVTPSRTV